MASKIDGIRRYKEGKYQTKIEGKVPAAKTLNLRTGEEENEEADLY